MAIDASGFTTDCDDLSLVSTYYQPRTRLLEAFNMTSAATAQAAHFAAQLQIQYPDYWPETIRALMIHSAKWPEALKRQIAPNDTKRWLKQVLRACGYGVPDLEAALFCAANSLTLVSEASIQPYERHNGKVRTREMHLYELPWPIEVLQDLGESPVEMRITLSYFVEPGPGEVGWKDRYRYASHALRFDLNSPGESSDEFVRRINAAAREEDAEHPGTPSSADYWTIGQARDKGSIHSDMWNGTAAELAASNFVAVSPRIGWWRERKHLGKCERTTRYSLIVSIHTPAQNIDIYTPVAQQIGITVPIATGSR